MEVRRCRGDDNRRRFALQLCTLRTYGRFLDPAPSVPLTILTHLNRQLELPPVLFLSGSEREATDSEHQDRIRHYLGYHAFDTPWQEQVARWLEVQAMDTTLPTVLLHRAEHQLRSWRVVLPAVSTLERLVASSIARAQHEIFVQIADTLPPAVCQALDELLMVAPDDSRSPLFRLKEYPPAASAAVILTYISLYQLARDVVAGQINLSRQPAQLVQQLARVAKRYDVQALKRFAPAKRHALLACFLVETEKTLLDQLVELHDQYMTTMTRRARHAFEERHRQFRRRAKEGVDVVLGAMDIVLAPDYHSDEVRPQIYRRLGVQRLQEAVDNCREFQRLEERGYLDELCARYSTLRRYLPTFLTLPFAAATGSDALMTAITLLRQIDVGELRELPSDTPCDFIPAAWRSALFRADGALDRHVWTIGLSLAIRDALRAGDSTSRPVVTMRRSGIWSMMTNGGKPSGTTPTKPWSYPRQPMTC